MSRNRPCGGSSATSGVKRSHQSAMAFSVLSVGGFIGIEHPQLRTDGAGIGKRQADLKTEARGRVVERKNLQRVVLLGDDDAWARRLAGTRAVAHKLALDAVDGQARQPQAEDTPPVGCGLRKGTHHISIP